MLLCLVLLLAGLGAASAQEKPPQKISPELQNYINQLLTDFDAATALVQQLKASLALRLSDYNKLLDLYNKALAASAQADRDLAQAQAQSAQAETSSEQTLKQLQQIKEDSTALKQSLSETKASLASYKGETDKVVTNLEIAAGNWKIVAFVGVGAASVETGYLVGGTPGAVVGGGAALGTWALGHFVFHVW